MSDLQTTSPFSRVKYIAAFAAIYLIWGSTYLAIKYAIQTLPPLTMTGVRFLVAGTILYLWALAKGVERPRRAHWGSAVLIGVMLFVGGHGCLVLGQQVVPSGIAALLVATAPIWMTVLDALRPSGERPNGRTMIGLGLGIAGVVLLIGPGGLSLASNTVLLGAPVVLLSAFFWSIGSVYSRSVSSPASLPMWTGMQMLVGGVMLLVAGACSGELARIDIGAISLRSVLSLGYLILAGSIIAFTAYVWLLGVTAVSKVGTYAYVNPVVAMFLGWALAAEPLTGRDLLAASIILLAVFLVTKRQRQPKTERVTATFSEPCPAVKNPR